VLEDSDRPRAFAEDLCDLLDVQSSEDAQEHHLGLIEAELADDLPARFEPGQRVEDSALDVL